jgi:polysaccharide export outer membrane protein
MKLTKYLKNPVVSVNVLKYQSKKILVLGEIKLPGLYQYEGHMTVFNAIGLAGGYNKHAELKNVLVVRNASYKPKQPDFYVVNIHKLIHDGNTVGNIALIPGDIVYVPKNIMGNIGDFMDYYLSRIQPAAESYGSITYGTSL